MPHTPMSNMADAWVPLMREALFNQLSFNKRYACPESNCTVIYGPKLARFENGMVSTTEWQADASLWKDDTFFDAGTFCLPSVSPEASLEAYKVEYDPETGIHHVLLTLKRILGLSTSSTSEPSSHVVEFSNGVMRAVPRRGKGGVSRHENTNGRTNSHCHPSSNTKAAVDLQEVDPAIVSIHFSDHMEAHGYTESEATLMLIDDSITATGRILGSSEHQPLQSHEHFDASIPSAILGTVNCSSAELPVQDVDNKAENAKPYSFSPLEELLLHQQTPSSPAHLEADAPISITYEADSPSNATSNDEYTVEQIASSDDRGTISSTNTRPEEAKLLPIMTDLGFEDDITPSPSSASASPSGDGDNTPAKPPTNATSPTFSLPLDLVEDYAPVGKVSKTISALDLDEKVSVLKPWHFRYFQWLDLASSGEQDYTNYTVEEREKAKELKCAPEDEGVHMSPRPSSPAEAEQSVRSEELNLGEPEYAEADQTVEVSPRLSSLEEFERPLHLGDLDLSATFGQGITDLHGESIPQEATVADEEIVAVDDTTLVESPNDYSSNFPQFHHYNLLRNPVCQASQTPSALSFWVTMACAKRPDISDPVCLKAVLSSQAARWVDPVLLEEGVSVQEEVAQDGSATAYRNSLIGLTKIQYEPYGTWLSDNYDDEQEIPQVVGAGNRELLEEYEKSYGYPGLQRPYFVQDRDVYHHSWSSPNREMKLKRGWESFERRGDSNLRHVLNEDSITTLTPHEVAEPTDLEDDEDEYVEDSSAFPADESELGDSPAASEDEERFREASALRSLLASSPRFREAMSPPMEGRFFTPGIREGYEELDDSNDSLDGDAWETDENGAFVSPKKGKARLGGEMTGGHTNGAPRADEDDLGVTDISFGQLMPPEGELSGGVPNGAPRADEDVLGVTDISLGQLMPPEAQGDVAPAFTICQHEVVDLPSTGTFRNPELVPGTTVPTDGAPEGPNALPMLVEEPPVQEDNLSAELSLPYHKYNDLSEIPLRPNLAAIVGQAAREAGRWLTENMLW